MLPQIADPSYRRKRKRLGDPKRKTLAAPGPDLKRLLMKTGLGVGLGYRTR